MNQLPVVTRATRALLQGAKADAPSMAARAKIWSGVSAASGLAGAAGVASASGAGVSAAGVTAGSVGVGVGVAGAAAGTVGAAKLLVVGALFGSAVTVGLAMTAMYVRPAAPPAATAEIQIGPAVAVVGEARSPGSMPMTTAALATAVPTATTTNATLDAPVSPASPASPASGVALLTAGARARATATPSPEDALMREASLVAEARSALVRGDAEAALRAVRAARRLPSHQLEPEELSLEAQALRVLGRGTEATAVDGTLKGKYPDHALAR